MKKLLRGGLGCLLASPALAQTSPFVPEKTERALANELSGDLAFESMRISTQWHKPSGSEGFFAVAALRRGASAGCRSRRRALDRPGRRRRRRGRAGAPRPGSSRRGRDGEGDAPRIVRRRETSIADYSRPADVTAELVDVGSGEKASDYDGKDVRGRIVLAFGSLGAVMEQAVWKRGAAGILSWTLAAERARRASRPDRLAGVPEHDGPHGEKTTFAFIISAREGKALSDRLRGEISRPLGRRRREERRGPCARASSSSRPSLPEKKTAMVEARIPGTDPSLPEIVLTSHLQEEKFSANDNQSGVASMLEIGRALTTLIAEGKLPRPAPRHPVLVVRRDLLRVPLLRGPSGRGEEGPRQPQPGHGRREAVGRLADAVHGAHALVAAVLPLGRRGERARRRRQGQQRVPRRVAVGLDPAGRRLLASRSFRRARNARALPRAGRSLLRLDRPPGLQRLVGRRSGDDAHQLAGREHPLLRRRPLADRPDAVEAQHVRRRRDRVVARERGRRRGECPASFVAARGAERLGRDLATAETWIATGEGTDPNARAAANLLDRGARQGDRGRRLDGRARVVARVRAGAAALLDGVAQTLRQRLPPASASTPARRLRRSSRLAARTPRRAAANARRLDGARAPRSPKSATRSARARARGEREGRRSAPSGNARKAAGHVAHPDEVGKLSPLMETEAMNWSTARRTRPRSLARVCAEALSAGWWYYGKTTPELVEKFLEQQAKDGLHRLVTVGRIICQCPGLQYQPLGRALPVARNPDRAGVRRPGPASGHPGVGAAVPAVVAADPDVAGPWRRDPDLDLRRRRARPSRKPGRLPPRRPTGSPRERSRTGGVAASSPPLRSTNETRRAVDSDSPDTTRASVSRSMLPPEMTMPTRRPASRSRSRSSPARPAAPAPSARLCVVESRSRSASAIWASETVTNPARPVAERPERSSRSSMRVARPSAKVSRPESLGTGRPACQESCAALAPAAWTP